MSGLPKPYYQDELVTLYCGDCREILPEMNVDSVDLALTDPPYGNLTEYDSYEDSRKNLLGLVNVAMPLVFRVAKVVLVTPGVGNMFLYPPPKWTLNWTVKAGAGAGPWGFCSWQPILAYGADPYLKNGFGRRSDTLITNSVSDASDHPCPKPIGVWKWLMIRGSPFESDVILDPFAGSGTTLVAAKLLKRRAIGIEISKAYCDIIVKRLNSPIPLFNKPEQMELMK